jgi:hypothetical protein
MQTISKKCPFERTGNLKRLDMIQRGDGQAEGVSHPSEQSDLIFRETTFELSL